MAQYNDQTAYRPAAAQAPRQAFPKVVGAPSKTAVPSTAKASTPTAGPPPTVDPNQSPWEQDPVLQRIKARETQIIGDAEAAATAARTKALIDYGQGPFSILGNLAHQHELRQFNLNESLNKNNLWYGGYRGKQLNEEGRQYINEQNTADQNYQSQIGGIDTNLATIKSGAVTDTANAESDAYSRWLPGQLASNAGTPISSTTGSAPVQATASVRKPSTLRTNLLRKYG